MANSKIKVPDSKQEIAKKESTSGTNDNALLEQVKQMNASIAENTKAVNLLLKNANSSSKADASKADTDTSKNELLKLRIEKARIAKEQAEFSFEQSKLYAAKRAQDEAESQLKKQKEARASAYKDIPGSGIVKEVSQQSGGFGSSTLLSMATGGLINPAVANALGLDKAFSGLASWGAKKVGNVIGAPFQKHKENVEKQKAHDKAVSNAIEKAQLDKDIKAALAAHGFDVPEKKGSGKSSSATKEDPNEKVVSKLDTLNKTVEKNGKTEKKEEKKEEEGFLSKIFGFLGMVGGVVMNIIGKGKDLLFGGLKMAGSLLLNSIIKLPGLLKAGLGGLLKLGGIVGKGLIAAAPLLAGAIAFAVGGLIGKILAEKAVNHMDENTNLLGGQTARQSVKAAGMVTSNKNLKDYQTRTGDFAGYTMMKQHQMMTMSEEQGKLWGKNEEAIAQRKRSLGRAAKEALMSYDPELATGIETEIKEKKLSEAEGWDLYIKAADEGTKKSLEENKGLSIEEIKAKQAAKREAQKGVTEKSIEKQETGHPELTFADKMEKLDKLVADGELTQDQAEQIKAEMQLTSQESAEKGYPALVNNYNEMSTNDMMSEGTMNVFAANRQNAAQMNQMTQSVNNNTNNSNSSNVYQTNITQHSDKGVYATGDVARTMLTS